MLILGIDPGLARTGLGLINPDRSYHSHLLLVTNPKHALEVRLHDIFTQAQQYLLDKQIGIFVIEQLFVGSNRNTIIKLSMVQGILLLLAKMHQAAVVQIPTKIIKQKMTGQGAAEKQQVGQAVRDRLNIDLMQQDSLDALACALCWLPDVAVT